MFARLRFLGPCLALLSAAGPLRAADYYWNPADASANSWFLASYWKPSPDGSGSSPPGFSNQRSYSTNGRPLATGFFTSGTDYFPGGALILDGGQISIKATGAAIAQVPLLVVEGSGGAIVAANSANVFQRFTADALQADAGVVELSGASDEKSRTLVVTIGTLTGSAPIRVSSASGDGRVIRVAITTADAYTGALQIGRGIVDFDSDFVSGGALAIAGTGRLILDRTLGFASVTIDGAPLAAGAYSRADLSAAYPDHFLAFGEGVLHVAATPAPPPPPPPPALVTAGLNLVRDTVVDTAGLNFASGTWGTSINGQTFQQDALISYGGHQYAAYWADPGRPAIARRALPDGAWQTIVFDDYGPITHTDVHNVITVGISADDGTVHLAFDHHATTLRYRRSIAGVATNPAAHAWTQALFGATTSALVPGQSIASVTYPQFFPTPEGRLQFCYRSGSSGNGDWHFYEYAGGAWTRLGMLFSKSGTYSGKTSRSAYPNQFRYDAAGRLHVTWVWREQGTNLTGNHDLGYAYSDDRGRTWRNNAGAAIASVDNNSGASTAISIGSAGHVVLPVRYNWGLMNTTTQFTDAKGRVHTLVWRNPDDASAASLDMTGWRYHHCWRDTDGAWRESVLPFKGRKPQMVVDEAGNLHVIHGVGPDLNYANSDPGTRLAVATATEASGWTDWTVRTFTDARVYHGEPLLDYGRWERERVLSIYFQERPATAGSPSSLRVLDFVSFTPRQAWSATHFGDSAAAPDIAGDLADPDRDGLPNLLEYAFGTAPRTPDAASAGTSVSIVADDGRAYAGLAFVRRADADAGVLYQLEESADLVAWTTLEIAPRLLAPPSDLGNGLELVSVRGDTPLAPGARAFLRVRVTAISP